MKPRKIALVFAVAVASLSVQSARADVMWEHIGTLQTSMKPRQPLMQVKMYSTWTAQRHRLLLNYAFAPSVANRAGQMERGMPSLPMFAPMSSSSMSSMVPMVPMGSVKPFGSVAFVDRLDDDRVLAYESQSRLMISEPRRALMKRLRLNPWKKLAPELANVAPPTLSDVQRERLVAETGALVAPIRKYFSKTYFRTLPGTKTFYGLTGQGYRLTQLVNFGGVRRNQSWARITTEWYTAPEDATDSDISTFNAQKQRERKAMGGLTNSMWINEYFALAAIPNDPILRAAYNTLRVPADAPEGAFRGTPLLATVKVTLPPLQRAQYGDILFTLRLSARNNNTLGNTVFEAPSGYTKYDIQPALKKLDPILDGSAWISLMDAAFKNM